MKQTLTCINCPIGCRITVTVDGDAVTDIQGASCPRGETYARQEAISPTRMVTAVLNVAGCPTPLSVKTAAPIPKDKIFACMREIESANVSTPVKCGDVICKDVCGTGVDVIATRELP